MAGRLVLLASLAAVAAYPSQPDETTLLRTGIQTVERKNADLYQQVQDAQALAASFNVTQAKARRESLLSEVSSLGAEEKSVRKKYHLEKKGCCGGNGAATNHKLTNMEIAMSVQYQARISLTNRLLDLKNLAFMAQSDRADLEESVNELRRSMAKKGNKLSLLKKESLQLATELKAKDPSFSLDKETQKDKDSKEPASTFDLTPTPNTMTVQEQFQKEKRDANAPKSSFLERAEYNAGNATVKVNPNMVPVEAALQKSDGTKAEWARARQIRSSARLVTMKMQRDQQRGDTLNRIKAVNSEAVDTDSDANGKLGYSSKPGTSKVQTIAARLASWRSQQMRKYVEGMNKALGETDRAALESRIKALPADKQVSARRPDRTPDAPVTEKPTQQVAVNSSVNMSQTAEKYNGTDGSVNHVPDEQDKDEMNEIARLHSQGIVDADGKVMPEDEQDDSANSKPINDDCIEQTLASKRKKTAAAKQPASDQGLTAQQRKEQIMFQKQLALSNASPPTNSVDRLQHLDALMNAMKPVVKSLSSTVNAALNAHPGDDVSSDSEGPVSRCKKYSAKSPQNRYQVTGVGLHGKPEEAADEGLEEDSFDRKGMTQVAAQEMHDAQKRIDDQVASERRKTETRLSSAEKKVNQTAHALNVTMATGLSGLQDALDDLHGLMKVRQRDRDDLQQQWQDTKQTVADMHEAEVARQKLLWSEISSLKGTIMQMVNRTGNESSSDAAKGSATADYSM